MSTEEKKKAKPAAAGAWEMTSRVHEDGQMPDGGPLADGYEPFAVTYNANAHQTEIWYRRKA